MQKLSSTSLVFFCVRVVIQYSLDESDWQAAPSKSFSVTVSDLEDGGHSMRLRQDSSYSESDVVMYS